MKHKSLRANLLLLLTAAIWGFAFTAQRAVTDVIGSLTFNGIRFALGGLSLLPLLAYFERKKKLSGEHIIPLGKTLVPGLLAGTVLFIAVTVQQYGIMYTTAGKASFITGLYVVIVPLFGILLKHQIGLNSWLGAGLAAIGLYLLRRNGQFHDRLWGQPGNCQFPFLGRTYPLDRPFGR